MLKRLIKIFFDYDIIGEYLDTAGDGIYKKKYIKRYYLRCFKKYRKKYFK